MTSSTALSELTEFLDIAQKQGYLNDNTAQARKTACSKMFSVLEEGQQSVEYVRENLAVIKARFQNLNKEVRGSTVEEYSRRVQIVLNDYAQWKSDRAAWERASANRATSARDSTPAGEKVRNGKEQPKASKPQPDPNPDARTVSFPLRSNFEISVTIPREGITVSELKRLAYFLLPYAKDWEPGSSRAEFPMLDSNAERPEAR